MSHYTVAVITKPGKSVEEALEPFDEGIKVQPYIVHTKRDIISNKRKEYQIAIRERELLLNNVDFKRTYADNYLLNILPDELQNIDLYSNQDMYQQGIADYPNALIDKNGNVLSTYNPNAKWDWYEIGGRWNDSLKLKNGSTANSAAIKDIDFSINKDQYDDAIRFWELYIEKGVENLTEEEQKEIDFVFYNKEYYLQKYKTKEQYAIIQGSFSTYAILDSKGEWHEPGSMGWFGMSNASLEEETKFADNYMNLIKKEESNNILTVVDCHI